MIIVYEDDKYGNILYEPTNEEWQDFLIDSIMGTKKWDKFCEMFEDEIKDYFKDAALESYEDATARNLEENIYINSRYYK